MKAYSIKVRGVVQGVGFRPFVFRLACEHKLAGWVLNGQQGVEIHVEGSDSGLEDFIRGLRTSAPAASQVSEIDVQVADPGGLTGFTIRQSQRAEHPTTRISPDLPVCDECLREMGDSADKRYHYPYINCTNCGPRYSVTLRLPYDRQNTTMSAWPLDDFCCEQYENPEDRRFHAQPVACPECGPGFHLQFDTETVQGSEAAIGKAAQLLAEGKIVAVKGIGGYHLACDARNASAVESLRKRKFRKEKAFAVMVRDVDSARAVVDLSPQAETLLTSVARPIVLAPAKVNFDGVAPGCSELGVMLAYAPLHYLLFEFGAPEVLVMTSANRSSEPIAYEDADALARLSSIADVFLIGDRPIARRVDDSVARAGALGATILRRARGYAPGAVATIPSSRPILAVGADLKNAITLVVKGQAFVSQHIGDLSDYACLRAFEETINDLCLMYEVDRNELIVAHDCHPVYTSTCFAKEFAAASHIPVQHHRAHIASVLAELGDWEKRVIGVSFDGTGFGDDGAIWGGEIFLGSVREGFERIAHLRCADLPGGDAAALHPVQAAAGFLTQIDNLPDLFAPPFSFPSRYRDALTLAGKGIRSFQTTSVGRLFDTAAALLGFTRSTSFEGQAAMWLEQLARSSSSADAYPFPFENNELDFRSLLSCVAWDRAAGRPVADVARAFQRGVASGLSSAIAALSDTHRTNAAVLSGGVFQNELLLCDLASSFVLNGVHLSSNRHVPPNDGGISLGQAALAALAPVPAE